MESERYDDNNFDFSGGFNFSLCFNHLQQDGAPAQSN